MRENKFQDHATKNKKKIKAAFRYLLDSNIVLSIIYLIILAIGIDYISLVGHNSLQKSEQIQKIIVFFILFFTICFNLFLEINRVDYQVFDIDYKLKNLVASF